jgi:hypothetical protein
MMSNGPTHVVLVSRKDRLADFVFFTTPEEQEWFPVHHGRPQGDGWLHYTLLNGRVHGWAEPGRWR